LLKGIKRRVTNHSRVEIFEEEEDLDEGTQQVQVDQDPPPFGRGASRHELDDFGKDLRLTINAKMDDQEESNLFSTSGKRLNERFHGKTGRGSILSRLSDPHHIGGGGHLDRLGGRMRRDSGDSLERDNGEDLRAELDGRHAANMVIQVRNKDMK
jgi:hypothetical protein